MKLLFFGDLAAPEDEDIEIINKFLKESKIWDENIIIGNMEGLLVKKEKSSDSLYNSEKILDLFKDTRRTILALANNHIKDMPRCFHDSIETLKKNEIGYVRSNRHIDNGIETI